MTTASSDGTDSFAGDRRNTFLQSRPSIMQTSDIPSLALSQTIFAETQMAPLVSQEIKRVARQHHLRLG